MRGCTCMLTVLASALLLELYNASNTQLDNTKAKECNSITYFDKGSQRYEFCLHLCNPGGGQQTQCEQDCQEYLDCIGGEGKGAPEQAEGLAAGWLVLIILVVAGVVTAVSGSVLWCRRKRRSRSIALFTQPQSVDESNRSIMPSGGDVVHKIPPQQ